MDNFMSGMFFSFILVLIFSIVPGSKIYNYDKAISECQKELPRDQKCVIIAVPETTE